MISGGRVEFGTSRSSTRAELEGFGIHPHDTREMGQEALSHIVGPHDKVMQSIELMGTHVIPVFS